MPNKSDQTKQGKRGIPGNPASPPGTLVGDLLTSSTVRLFGRTIGGIDFRKSELVKSLTNKQLINELENLPPDTELKLARIYAFSFEGQFYTLPKPTVFLVAGKGVDPKTDTGLANKALLDFEDGIKVWKSDKDDVALRADIVQGTLDDVLIDATLSPTSKYPIISRGGTPQEASWRDGQMIARNRLQ